MSRSHAPAFLCADIGTSSLKAALIDTEGHALALVRETYPAQQVVSGKVCATDWENALARGWARLASETRVRPEAICISGNGPTLVPLTASGAPLSPLHWHDPRSADGPLGTQSLYLPYVRAFMQRRSADYAQTAALYPAPEWLLHRLGAEPLTALPAPAYESYYWDAAQCAVWGVDPGLFPPFAPVGSRCGRVSPEAERDLGLPSGVPLVLGGPDFIMALIGVGALHQGRVCDRAGTSEGINLCSPSPPDGTPLRVLPHLEPGLWNVSRIIPASGRLFDWFRRLTGQNARPYPEVLADLIPTQGVFQPAMARFFPHESSGRLFLDSAGPKLMNPEDLGRAVLEAMGFLVRSALSELADAGFPVTEMWVSGGQGKNPQWNQFKADLSGCALGIPELCDGELAGDAVTASVALGENAHRAEAVKRMIRLRARYAPLTETRAQYTEYYCLYRERQKTLEARWNQDGMV